MEARKPGRPAKSDNAMSDKQRAAMYRTRRYEAASMAHENLSSASTAVLLAGLARQLKAIGDSDHAHVARYIAGQLIRPCSESPNNKQDKALPAESISEVMALFVQNESNKAYLHR